MIRVLIANRGEIACRIARTCRRLGIRTVAVFSDADAGALHVRSCDTAVHLPGVAPADTYLRGDLLVDAARRAGADAVHPGYGFLAESADFARAVLDAGLVWIGPPPDAIAAMGSKVEAKALMRAAGVPVLLDSSVADVDEIGLPLLVKASAGGGGRGMRIVRTLGELDQARADAEREAASAFGDGAVFCERYVEGGRHVEVQIIGDTHGTVVSLHERDCSIQRRHQKIVEECPSPAVDGDLRPAARRRGDRRRPRRRLRRRRHRRVPARAGRPLLVPRDEHPAAGRASGDRAGDRARPRRAADRRRRRSSRCPLAALDAAARRPRHRGPPDGRGPGRRLPAVDGHVQPLRHPRRRARRHGRRGRLDDLPALRLDGRQGHRPRADPRRRHPCPVRRPLRGPAARPGDQPRPARAHPRPPVVRRRRRAHRVPRRAPVQRADRRRRAPRSRRGDARRAGRQPARRRCARRDPVRLAQQPGRRPGGRAGARRRRRCG